MKRSLVAACVTAMLASFLLNSTVFSQNSVQGEVIMSTKGVVSSERMEVMNKTCGTKVKKVFMSTDSGTMYLLTVTKKVKNIGGLWDVAHCLMNFPETEYVEPNREM